MRRFNKNSLLLLITTSLYLFGQILYIRHFQMSLLWGLYLLLSVLITGMNIFFIFRLSRNLSEFSFKVYNSYLLVSTFIFYLAYCLKIAIITTYDKTFQAPAAVELLLLLTILFNTYQIIKNSLVIKRREKNKRKKNEGLLKGVFSWADALLSAVIFVIIIHMFLIQLYKIPTESMFPVFVTGDRPVVSKLNRGPSLPFTRFRIPPIGKIERGDIVTLRNPRYEKTPLSELKHLFSQFVFMISLSAVNIDKYDENGFEKADPIVKRVIALPGEQIQIINDKIYIRNNLNEEFKLQEENIYSETDLYKLDENTQSKLERMPLDRKMRDMLSQLDREIESIDREIAVSKIEEKILNIKKIRQNIIYENPSIIKNSYKKQYDSIRGNATSLQMSYMPFQKMEYLGNDSIYNFYHIDDDELWSETIDFISSVSDGETINSFDTIAYKTELMYKSLISSWILYNLEYMENVLIKNVPSEDLKEGNLAETGKALNRFQTYILGFYDFRNLAPFPQNKLLDNEHYFLMGDNRYNSIDLRHRLQPADRFFIKNRPQTFVYGSLLDPKSIHESDIEGSIVFRVFPFSRIGIPD